MNGKGTGAATSMGAVAAAWFLTSIFYFYQYSMRSAPAVMVPELTSAFGLTAVGIASLVGRERLHVVDSGAFFAEPESVYDGVCDFLGLPRMGYPAFEKHNARPRATALGDAVYADLADHYAPFDADLESWLGRRLSWRR